MGEEKDKSKCEQCKQAEPIIMNFQKAITILTLILLVIGGSLIGLHAFLVNIPKFIFNMAFGFVGFAFILFLLKYLPRRIIGSYVYYFKDKYGTIHSHTQRPTWLSEINEHCWETPPEKVVKWNAKDFLVSGPLICVKYGGWFKTPWVAPPRGSYKSQKAKVYTNNDDFYNDSRYFDLHLDDSSMGAVTPVKTIMRKIEMGTIIQLIKNFDKIEHMLSAANSANRREVKIQDLYSEINILKRDLEDSKKAGSIAKPIRDRLGYAMIERLVQIHKNKPMSRSEHARDLRLSIENTIRDLPDRRQLVESWAEQVEGAQEITAELLDRFDQEELAAKETKIAATG